MFHVSELNDGTLVVAVLDLTFFQINSFPAILVAW